MKNGELKKNISNISFFKPGFTILIGSFLGLIFNPRLKCTDPFARVSKLIIRVLTVRYFFRIKKSAVAN